MNIPINLHLQYITDERGEKTAIVLPIRDFEKILEDIEDLAKVAERKDEKITSHRDFIKELKEDAII
jgi:hypothetical protein